MKIRFTLEIKKGKKETPAKTEEDKPDPPVILDVSNSSTEHAGEQPLGFTIPIPSHHQDY